jgi:hypothetical protein
MARVNVMSTCLKRVKNVIRTCFQHNIGFYREAMARHDWVEAQKAAGQRFEICPQPVHNLLITCSSYRRNAPGYIAWPNEPIRVFSFKFMNVFATC